MSFLRHPIETVRTAPFGSALMGIQIPAIAYNVRNALESYSPESTATSLAAASLCIGALVVARCNLVERQLNLKERLKGSIEREGFNDRILAPTTDEWCNRQAARVACEKFDMLAEYVELCDSRADTAKLTFIPHI